MKEAISHRGFALLDILQPCVTFNKVNTYSWYSERVYRLKDHDPQDRIRAFQIALQWGDRIPTGVIYRNERSIMEDRIPILKEGPLTKRPFDLNKILEEEAFNPLK